MTHVTCRLTARNRDQLRNPTLGYGLPVRLLVVMVERGVCMFSCGGRIAVSESDSSISRPASAASAATAEDVAVISINAWTVAVLTYCCQSVTRPRPPYVLLLIINRFV